MTSRTLCRFLTCCLLLGSTFASSSECNTVEEVPRHILCYVKNVTFSAQVDVCRCTHVIVPFSDPDNGNLTLNEATLEFLRDSSARSGRRLRRIVSLAFGNDEIDSLPVDDMIFSVEKLIDDLLIDGVEINWQQPSTGDHSKKHRASLVQFAKKMHASLQEKMIITSNFTNGTTETEGPIEMDAVRPVILLRLPTLPESLVKGFDLKPLTKTVDLFVVDSDNITDPLKSNITYHPSRLMGLSDILNTDSVLDLVISLGVPADRLVAAVPTFATLFRLANPAQNTPGSPVVEGPTYISSGQVCMQMSEGNWTVERDDDLTGTYAYSDSGDWIAFDDQLTAQIKAKYFLLREIAGVAVKTIDMDDFMVRCSFDQEEAVPMTLTYYKNFFYLDSNERTRRHLVESLEEDLTSAASVFTSPIVPSDRIRASPYRVVRIVDRSGETNVLRQPKETSLRCSRQGYYRHPEDCSRFYRCVKFDQYVDDFTVFEYDCPEGLVFDEKWEVCTWPSQAAPCDGSSEIQPVPAEKFNCPGEGFFADPENCRWFFACRDYARDGTTFTQYEFRCPFGLVFDEQNLLCNWPWLVPQCSSGKSKETSYTNGQPIQYQPRLPPSIGSPGYLAGKLVTGEGLYKDPRPAHLSEIVVSSDCVDCASPILKVTNGESHPFKKSHQQLVSIPAQTVVGESNPVRVVTATPDYSSYTPYYPNPGLSDSNPVTPQTRKTYKLPYNSGSSVPSSVTYTEAGVPYSDLSEKFKQTEPAYPSYAEKPPTYESLPVHTRYEGGRFQKPEGAEEPKGGSASHVTKYPIKESGQAPHGSAPSSVRHNEEKHRNPSVDSFKQTPSPPSAVSYSHIEGPHGRDESLLEYSQSAGQIPPASGYKNPSYPEFPYQTSSVEGSRGNTGPLGYNARLPNYHATTKSPSSEQVSHTHQDAQDQRPSDGPYTTPVLNYKEDQYRRPPAESYFHTPATNNYGEGSRLSYKPDQPASHGTPKSYEQPSGYAHEDQEKHAKSYPYGGSETDQGIYHKNPSGKPSGSVNSAPSYSPPSTIQAQSFGLEVPLLYNTNSPSPTNYAPSYDHSRPASTVPTPGVLGGSLVRTEEGGSKVSSSVTAEDHTIPPCVVAYHAELAKGSYDRQGNAPLPASYPGSYPLPTPYRNDQEGPARESKSNNAQSVPQVALYYQKPHQITSHPKSDEDVAVFYQMQHQLPSPSKANYSPTPSGNVHPTKHEQRENSKSVVVSTDYQQSTYQSTPKTSQSPGLRTHDADSSYLRNKESDSQLNSRDKASYTGITTETYNRNPAETYHERELDESKSTYPFGPGNTYPTTQRTYERHHAEVTRNKDNFGGKGSVAGSTSGESGVVVGLKGRGVVGAKSHGADRDRQPKWKDVPAILNKNGQMESEHLSQDSQGPIVTNDYANIGAAAYGEKIITVKVPSASKPALLDKWSKVPSVLQAASDEYDDAPKGVSSIPVMPSTEGSYKISKARDEKGKTPLSSHTAINLQDSSKTALKNLPVPSTPTTSGKDDSVATKLKGKKELNTSGTSSKNISGGASAVSSSKDRDSGLVYGQRYLEKVYNEKPGNDTLGLSPEVCVRAGLFRHPADCQKFYECYWDRWINQFTVHIFKCPVQLVYDEYITACNWPFAGPACVPHETIKLYNQSE